MTPIRFEKWNDKTSSKKYEGFIQTINNNYINIYLFGRWWKRAIVWTTYENKYGD